MLKKKILSVQAQQRWSGLFVICAGVAKVSGLCRAVSPIGLNTAWVLPANAALAVCALCVCAHVYVYVCVWG